MRLGSKDPVRKDQKGTVNRSDEIRSQRSKRTQKRLNVVSSRITNPAPKRQVVVRGGSFGTPIHRQVETPARRKFYVALDRAAGSEVRLPSLPIIRPGWRLLSGLLTIFMAVAIYSMLYSTYCQIDKVEVKGVKRLTPEEVTAAIKLDNTSIVEVDAGQIREKIASTFPELMKISVSIELPNVVAINVVERKPVLAVKKGDQLNWVDASGVIFPPRGDVGKLVTIQTTDNFPLAPAPIDPALAATQEAAKTEGIPTPPVVKKTSGVTDLQKLDPNLLAAALGLSKKLPPNTRLVYSQQNGLGWKDPQGWQVYIGTDLNNFQAKFNMYKQIAGELSAQGIKPSLVSVEHIDAPFYRLEQ